MAARAVALSSLSRRALSGISVSCRLSASLQPSSTCCSTSTSSSASDFRRGSRQLVRRSFACSTTKGGGTCKMLKMTVAKLNSADGSPAVADEELQLSAADLGRVDASPSLGLTKAANRSFPEVTHASLFSW